MGLFDVHCGYSGIALRGDARLVLMQKAGRRWAPIAAPVASTYNRLGGIDERRKDKTFAALSAWLCELTGAEDFEESLQSLTGGEVVFGNDAISYSLVDEGVYQALPGSQSPASEALPNKIRVAWKTAIAKVTPIDFADSDQYCGLKGEFGCARRIARAKKKFASERKVLAAIAKNEALWKQWDDEQGDDDDD
jgi:hypothetical protein